MSPVEVRHAEVRDVAALTAIRVRYVLHLKHGFREVGTFVAYAHKWDRDISTTWFQRHA